MILQLVVAHQYSIVKDQADRSPVAQFSVPADFNRRTDELNNRLTPPKAARWWAWVDLNYRPRPYQGRALAT